MHKWKLIRLKTNNQSRWLVIKICFSSLQFDKLPLRTFKIFFNLYQLRRLKGNKIESLKTKKPPEIIISSRVIVA
ncbi:hypothetical protein H5410_006330 [Solanum commersonii]|uniref:Uncharacterized protein n=1 Tax=Solanum commersonii TaxID=4109 RepID=A0A9J6A9K3_SOLCO|nr:hypothetical protein H5410_006330 [Solanum commersonii]